MLYIIRNKENHKVAIRTESFYNVSLWYRKMPNREKYEMICLRKKKVQ